jgi:D-sedoheptulose 7-phosphate isomerase
MPRRFSNWIAGSSPAMIKSLPNSVEVQQRGAMALSHASEFFANVLEVSRSVDANIVEKMAGELASLRDRGGRLFLLGVGGSAGNCSHAVNDFRKLCGIEAYSPIDNVSELTARANDEGWETIFTGWLEVSRIGAKDAILVLSVGGGDSERNVSTNIVKAIDLAKERGARVLGIVGRDSGHTARRGDVVIVVPAVDPKRVTPLAEAFQAVIWHCLVSHPALQIRATKW